METQWIILIVIATVVAVAVVGAFLIWAFSGKKTKNVRFRTDPEYYEDLRASHDKARANTQNNNNSTRHKLPGPYKDVSDTDYDHRCIFGECAKSARETARQQTPRPYMDVSDTNYGRSRIAAVKNRYPASLRRMLPSTFRGNASIDNYGSKLPYIETMAYKDIVHKPKARKGSVNSLLSQPRRTVPTKLVQVDRGVGLKMPMEGLLRLRPTETPRYSLAIGSEGSSFRNPKSSINASPISGSTQRPISGSTSRTISGSTSRPIPQRPTVPVRSSVSVKGKEPAVVYGFNEVEDFDLPTAVPAVKPWNNRRTFRPLVSESLYPDNSKLSDAELLQKFNNSYILSPSGVSSIPHHPQGSQASSSARITPQVRLRRPTITPKRP